jgi:hypothetical protein
MEMSILKGLSWKLSPPTPLTFLHHFIKLLPRELPSGEITVTKGAAQFLVELSACDYFFVCVKPSSIAYAALLNSIDRMMSSAIAHNFKGYDIKNNLLQRMESLSGIIYSDEVKQCQVRLQEIFQAGGYDDNDGFCSQRSLSSPVSSAVVLSSSS